jgi:hypothetical protein
VNLDEPRRETQEEILVRAAPLPPRSETVIEDLTESEDEIFWRTIIEA